MKKILLLFVLFLGFSFGAFAANTIETKILSTPCEDFAHAVVDYYESENGCMSGDEYNAAVHYVEGKLGC